MFNWPRPTKQYPPTPRRVLPTPTNVGSLDPTEGQFEDIFILTITLKDSSGNEVVERYATSPIYFPDGTHCRALVDDPGSFKTQIFGSGGRQAGFLAPSWGSISLINADGEFNRWMAYYVDGAKVVCEYGWVTDSYPEQFQTVYVGYIDGTPEYGDLCVANIRGREYLFDKSIVTAPFDDTSGSIGGVDLEVDGVAGSRLKFLVMGTPGYYSPILTSTIDNVWFAGANLIKAVTVVDGGVELLNAGGLSVGGDGGYYKRSLTEGSAWIQTVTTIRVECRIKATGYYSPGDVTPRRWTIADLANRAGIAFDPVNMPEGSINYDAGNRVVETETYKQVFTDVSKFQVAVIGMNRLDQFYAQPIEPSFIGSPIHDFVDGHDGDGNSSKWRFLPMPGNEKRVYRAKVFAGANKKSSLAGVVDEAIRDELSRDPWLTEFRADVTYYYGPFVPPATILDQDASAVEDIVEIIGNEFDDIDAMEDWAVRYMGVFGARQFCGYLDSPFTRETMRIKLLDAVTLTSSRYTVIPNQARIWSVDAKLKERMITFGVWAHEASNAPTIDEIGITQENTAVGSGSSGGGSGSAAGGQGDAAPQLEVFAIPITDKSSALATGESDQDFIVPYDLQNVYVAASISTVQTSGTVATIDVKRNGTTVLGTKITIDNNERHSFSASAQPVMSVTNLSKGDRLTFHKDAVGTGGKGLSVYVFGYQKAV